MSEHLLLAGYFIVTPLAIITTGVLFDAIRAVRREQRAASQGRHPSRKRG